MNENLQLLADLLFRPSRAAARLGDPASGWLLPAGLSVLGTLASALLLTHAPAEYLAAANGGAEPPAARTFAFLLALGLAGEVCFTLFFAALVCAFASALSSGRLALRLPLVLLGPAAYGFFYLLPLQGPAFAAAKWLLAAGAAAFAAYSARRAGSRYLHAAKIMLSLSVLTVLTAAAAWGCVLAGSPGAYANTQLAAALISLFYLVRYTSAFSGLSGARAAVAAIGGLGGGAAFLYSLKYLGLISDAAFQALMMT